MTLKRIVLAVALVVGLAMTISAQTAEVRFLYGEPYDSAEHPISKGDNKVVVRRYKLVKGAEGLRLTIPKEHITADVWGIEVLPPFMKAKKGDEGWWMNCRGVYGHFDRDNGSYRKSKNILPIYALKRGSTLWWGHVKQWRPTLDRG